MSDPFSLAPLPPDEAVAYFAAKGSSLVPTFAWQDFWQEDHAASFTVAKSAGYDILQDIYDAQQQAIAQGQTFAQFRDRLTPILQAKGWWGRQDVVDPATGKIVSAQLGSTRRLQTIFDVNMRTSYAAGAWNGFVRNQATRPYLRYTAILDSRTRPAHRLWHGTILPIDHPWWQTHFPPCGWNCRCRAISVSDADLKRYGWNVSDGPLPDPTPPQLYKNVRTGNVSLVPWGIDPGFAYNPGTVAVDLHAARIAASKWVSGVPSVTAAEQAASIRFMQPILTRDFGDWVNKVASGGVPLVGDQRVVGALTQSILDDLAARGITPGSGAVTITDRTVAHMLRTAKASRGTALPVSDLMQLPDLVMNPVSVLFDTQDPSILYVYEPSPGLAGKIVVRIDFADKVNRQTTISNAVRTSGIVQPIDLSPPRYVPM